jgi:hypothetical protein
MFFWTYRNIGLGTPPPCCVDDAPFTTCCAPPATTPARGTVIATIRRPYILPPTEAPAPPTTQESAPVTTAEYRRDGQGRFTR